jgi:hypothetical protein
MGAIQRLIDENIVTPKFGEIHLGTANDWTVVMLLAYTVLNQHKIPNTGTSRYIGVGLHEYSFTSNDGDTECVVVYMADVED